MNQIKEAWVHTRNGCSYFDEEAQFLKFLKTNPKNVVSIQITETMTVDEFNRCHPELRIEK